MKHYSIQFNNAKAEQVDETQLAGLKERFGSRFAEFEVKELEVPAKPKDLQAAPAEPKATKADKPNKSE